MISVFMLVSTHPPLSTQLRRVSMSRERGEISGRVRVLLWGIWVSGWESRTRGGSSQRVSGCQTHPILCATFSCR
jgi:hypothetical protein